MIRRAKMSDFDHLVPLLPLVHQRSPFKDIPLDDDHMRRTFAMAVAMPAFFCEVSVDDEDKPRGLFAGGIDVNVWGARVATDVLVLEGRETNVLINRFYDWAKSVGADIVTLTEVTNNPRYKKLIKLSEFSRIGTVYSKEI
jgi:hypothetical protein